MRQTTLHIAESLGTLTELEQYYADDSFKLRRLKMLLQLAQSPTLTIEQHATLLGCDRRVLQGWLRIYRKGGITALLHNGNSTNSAKPKITNKVLNQLAQLRAVGKLQIIEDVRDWLLKEHNLTYSVSGTWKLLKRIDSKKHALKPILMLSTQQRITEGMQALATTLSTVSLKGNEATFLTLTLKKALEGMFPHIDRVSLLVRFSSDPTMQGSPDRKDIGFAKTLIVAKNLNRSPQKVVQEVTGIAPYQWILKTFEQQNFPLHQYHPPLHYDYYVGHHIYVGSIFFWRKIEHPPIPDDTVQVIEGLQDSIAATMLSLLMRHQQSNSVMMQMKQALSNLAKDYYLSYRESQVLTLIFSGLPHKQIADVLDISEHTVKVHIRNIRKRTGTHNHPELIALLLSTADREFHPPLDPLSQESLP